MFFKFWKFQNLIDWKLKSLWILSIYLPLLSLLFLLSVIWNMNFWFKNFFNQKHLSFIEKSFVCVKEQSYRVCILWLHFFSLPEMHKLLFINKVNIRISYDPTEHALFYVCVFVHLLDCKPKISIMCVEINIKW